jgi:hypothetical protein
MNCGGSSSFVGGVLRFWVIMVVGRLWFVVGVGVIVVVGGVIVFSELEQDEQGMGVLTWCPKIQTMTNDERRSSSFGCHVAVGDMEPGSYDKE